MRVGINAPGTTPSLWNSRYRGNSKRKLFGQEQDNLAWHGAQNAVRRRRNLRQAPANAKEPRKERKKKPEAYAAWAACLCTICTGIYTILIYKLTLKTHLECGHFKRKAVARCLAQLSARMRACARAYDYASNDKFKTAQNSKNPHTIMHTA